MKKIMISDYNPSMGILIDVQHPEDYKKNPTPNSKNMYADKLLLNYKTVLDKNQKLSSLYFLFQHNYLPKVFLFFVSL